LNSAGSGYRFSARVVSVNMCINGPTRGAMKYDLPFMVFGPSNSRMYFYRVGPFSVERLKGIMIILTQYDVNLKSSSIFGNAFNKHFRLVPIL